MAYVMHQFMFWGWKSCTDEPNGGICPIVCIIRKTSFWWVAAACLEEVRHFWPSVITADTPALGTGLRLPDGDGLLVLDLTVDGEGVQDENLLEWILPGSSGKDLTQLQVLIFQRVVQGGKKPAWLCREGALLSRKRKDCLGEDGGLHF